MKTAQVQKAIDAYLKTDETHRGLFDFFSAVWSVQNEVAEGLITALSDIDPEAARDALATHQPLFLLQSPDIDIDAFRKAVADVITVVVQHAGLGDESNEALVAADLPAAVDAEALAAALEDVDAFTASVSDSVGADEDGPLTPVTVDFILTSALTPFLEGPAQAALGTLDDFDWRIWNSGECPVCGSPASNARVLDEGELKGGRRMLACPLCRAEWEYERVRCARCGNRTSNDLHYLYDERDEGHRLHLCDVCHGYIKVSFERDLNVIVIPAVEDVVTLALDDLAVSKGFSPLGDEEADA